MIPLLQGQALCIAWLLAARMIKFTNTCNRTRFSLWQQQIFNEGNPSLFELIHKKDILIIDDWFTIATAILVCDGNIPLLSDPRLILYARVPWTENEAWGFDWDYHTQWNQWLIG